MSCIPSDKIQDILLVFTNNCFCMQEIALRYVKEHHHGTEITSKNHLIVLLYMFYPNGACIIWSPSSGKSFGQQLITVWVYTV
jgi:hypothetical protein